MKSTKIMPPTWMLIALIAMLILKFTLPLAWIVPPLWNLLGLPLLGIGVMINLTADEAFRQAGTTIKPFQESSTLVTNGLFKFSRNPMYLGMVLNLFGIGVLFRSLSPFLVILPFGILLDQFYIESEERMLAEKFGPKWEAYKAKTRRWL